MASSYAVSPMHSPYHGQDLIRGEIRLLTIVSTEPGLELSTERHSLTEDLEFEAVSYVWGTSCATIEATCNGKSLPITPTVRDMLVHLNLYRPAPQRPLWIDAICINQDDMDEKSIQIPSMRSIFSQAAQVIIWMGIATSDTNAFMAEFPRVSQTARNWISTETDLFALGVREACAWPPDDDRFWTGFFYLLHGEWVQRLWTFQEAVLGKKAIILCGASSIDLDDFLGFIVEGYYGIRPYITGTSNHSRHNPFASDEVRIIQYFRDKVKDLGVVETRIIPRLLNGLRNRRVKEQVDRVWAITGLFEHGVQNDLASKVDYSIQAREEYSKTFVDFAKVILARSKSLSLLSVPPVLGPKKDGLPSWCPDFSGQGACFRLMVGNWTLPVKSPAQRRTRLLLHEESLDQEKCYENESVILNHSRRCFWTSEKDNILRIRGFVVDTVSETIESPWLIGPTDWATNPEWELLTLQNPSFAAAMSWELRTLALARRVFYGENDTMSSIPREYLMTLLLDCRISDQAELAYIDAMSVLQSKDPNNEFNQLEFPWVTRVDQWIRRLRSLCGHTFFSTTSGRIGIATPGCKLGDKICVIYGENSLHTLRWPNCGNSPDSSSGGALVEFKGVAFVPHLMEQHRSDDARLGEDEIFSIG